MKNQLKVEITEMFVAKPDKDRVYFGYIKRSRNEKDEMNLFCCIDMSNGGMLYANELDQKVLTKNLNDMAIMILDGNLHNDRGKRVYFCPDYPVLPLHDDVVHEMFIN